MFRRRRKSTELKANPKQPGNLLLAMRDYLPKNPHWVLRIFHKPAIGAPCLEGSCKNPQEAAIQAHKDGLSEVERDKLRKQAEEEIRQSGYQKRAFC